MRGCTRALACVLVALAALAAPCFGQAEEQPAPAIDPQAEKLVREMSETLAKLQHFELRVVDTIDDVLDSGRKIQYTHVRSATISRPRKLKIDVRGDVTNRSLWKDGTTVSVFDKSNKVYGQIEDPGTIDELIEVLSKRYDMTTPISDLFSADLTKIMTEKVQTGEYLGLHLAAKKKCHHLAFTQENVDWQVWIDAGKKPFPRKLLITYKQLPSHPQFTATIERLVELPEVADEVFAFKPPKGAEKIKVQPVESDEKKPAAPKGE